MQKPVSEPKLSCASTYTVHPQMQRGLTRTVAVSLRGVTEEAKVLAGLHLH